MTSRIGVLSLAFVLLASLVAACVGDREDRSASSASATPIVQISPTRSSLPSLAPAASPQAEIPATSTTAPTSIPEPTPTATHGADGTPLDQTEDVELGEEANWEIFVMNADGSEQHQITTRPERDFSPAWSPDGSRIVFVSMSDAGGGLFVMNSDGTDVRQLGDAVTSSPAWSPNGRQIVGTSIHGYQGDYPQIYIVASDSSAQQRLTSFENVPTLTLSMDNHWPAWSPDGQQIAFVAEQSDGPNIVHVMNVDGTNVRRLTDFPGRKASPKWSPDGELIAFSTEHPDSNIWVMRADGTDLRNLTSSPAVELEMSWSPDGRQLVFVRQSDAGSQIVVATPEGAEQRVLYESVDLIMTPRWSPDGQRIAFVRAIPEDYNDFFQLSGNIFAMNADGSNVQQLTDTPESESEPQWSPDGAKIAYTVNLAVGEPLE